MINLLGMIYDTFCHQKARFFRSVSLLLKQTQLILLRGPKKIAALPTRISDTFSAKMLFPGDNQNEKIAQTGDTGRDLLLFIQPEL